MTTGATGATGVRQWSEYQNALFRFGTDTTLNGVVVAVAGSGKTTAIEEFARRLPSTLAIKYLVFNKRNADEAAGRMPVNVEASTFHSACMSPLRRRLGRIKVDADKCRWILKDMQDKEHILNEGEFNRFARSVCKLVGMAKNSGFDTNIGPSIADEGAWQDVVDYHTIEVDGGRDADPDATNARLIELAQMVLERSNEQLWRIDFDDMLYLIVKLNVAMPTYDVVCVDEAQDTNSIQRVILKKMVGRGRLIAVGDPRQAIYGFRGATADAMDIIQRDFNCTVLPLSINYRCSAAVVEAAKAFCPQLEARPDAPAGSVLALAELGIDEFGAGDAVLCRTTVPIIQLAMRLISHRIPCVVLGRDIGAALSELVTRLRRSDGASTVGEFIDALDNYYTKELRRVIRRRNAEELIQALDDRCDSLKALCEPLDSEDDIQRVFDTIDALFGDQVNDRKVTLATVHKSKGLEFDTVYILNRSEMPHKKALLPWQQDQEQNLIYVAYTRAKVDLRFIELVDIA